MTSRALRDTILREGGLLAEALGAPPADPSAAARTVARSPRAQGHPADLELVVEAVHEGYLLHYGSPRLVSSEDPDLALLAGDRLYALGLERLAEAGDLDSVRALADLIALCAHAHATGDEDLAAAVWDAGLAEAGWGPHPALETAKDAVRAGDSQAAQALRAAARSVREGDAPAG